MRRFAVLAAVMAVVGVVGLVGPVGAGELSCTGYPEPTLTPTEGPGGTTLTISAGPDSSYCVPIPSPNETDAFVTIGLAPRTSYDTALATAQINGDGSWTATWDVPADQPAGPITLYATAWVDYLFQVELNGAPGTDATGFEMPEIDYQPLVFTVTAPATTSTTAAPTTTTSVPPSIRVSDDQLLPGEGFIVYGSGFQPGATVEVFLESTPVLIGTVVADAVGNVEAPVAVPADFAAGPHTVRLVGTGLGGGVLNLSVGVTVGSLVADAGRAPAEATPAAAGELPRTGGLPMGALTAGLGLVLAGAAVLRVRQGRAAA